MDRQPSTTDAAASRHEALTTENALRTYLEIDAALRKELDRVPVDERNDKHAFTPSAAGLRMMNTFERLGKGIYWWLDLDVPPGKPRAKRSLRVLTFEDPHDPSCLDLSCTFPSEGGGAGTDETFPWQLELCPYAVCAGTLFSLADLSAQAEAAGTLSRTELDDLKAKFTALEAGPALETAHIGLSDAQALAVIQAAAWKLGLAAPAPP